MYKKSPVVNKKQARPAPEKVLCYTSPMPRGVNDTLYAKAFEVELRKSDRRKAAILEAALNLLINQGVNEVSLLSVAQKAKMLRSHVAYYFPNKDALIDAVVHYVVVAAQESVGRFAENAPPGESRLRAYVEGNFAWFKEQPGHASVVVLVYHLSGSNKRYETLLGEAFLAGEERIYAILVSYLKGEKKELRRLARAIRLLIVGALTTLATSRSVAPETMFEDTWHAIELLTQSRRGRR